VKTRLDANLLIDDGNRLLARGTQSAFL
jgi:hypothetical protein